ncbi:MAG: hypothetical protein ACLGIN_06995, partial [Candidatus Sericytochromatia bacterium]
MIHRWSAIWLCLALLLAPAARAEGPLDMAVEGLECRPALEGYYVEVLVRGAPAEGALVEVVDAEGTSHQRRAFGPAPQRLGLTLQAPAVSATIDPGLERADADRFNNHMPRKIHLTPWPEAPQDAYMLRYFPGLTFKQGQAPVRPRGAPMMPPAQGLMSLGIGLEGRRAGAHGWQVLTTFGASPFAPSLSPRFTLHGYMLPHPNWGLDGDASVDLDGTLTTEFGTSLIMWEAGTPPSEAPALAHQLRLALGNQALAAGAYPYGALTLFRDDTATLGVASNLSLFGGLSGGWRALVEGQSTLRLTDGLGLRLGSSAGWSGGPLPAPNRLSPGLVSHDWQPADGRLQGRLAVLTPLARGLDWAMGPLATLTQVEASGYMEAAHLWGLPGSQGAMAGLGAELTLVQDTILGMPLALNVGYAVPIWGIGGAVSPWPGRIYIMTTDAFFPR